MGKNVHRGIFESHVLKDRKGERKKWEKMGVGCVKESLLRKMGFPVVLWVVQFASGITGGICPKSRAWGCALTTSPHHWRAASLPLAASCCFVSMMSAYSLEFVLIWEDGGNEIYFNSQIRWKDPCVGSILQSHSLRGGIIFQTQSSARGWSAWHYRQLMGKMVMAGEAPVPSILALSVTRWVTLSRLLSLLVF